MGLVAVGTSIALGGCSASSHAGDDDEVGSPGGTFVTPHEDGSADDEASSPTEAGLDYDAQGPRYDSAADAYTTYDAHPVDARPVDAQSGGLDASVFDAAPTGCVSQPIPGDAGMFHPTLPTVIPQSGADGGAAACGAGDLTGFYDACLGPGATSTACDAWFPGGAGTLGQQECGVCIRGTSTVAGALVYKFPNEVDEASVNDVACVLATDPSSVGVTCAQDTLDLEACLVASCAGCTNDGMGGGTDPDGTLVNACLNDAYAGACAAYAATANSDCTDTADGGAAAVCEPPQGTTFEADFFGVAAVLCGGS